MGEREKPYTPSLAVGRKVHQGNRRWGTSEDEAGAEFDRMIEAVRAEAWEAGAWHVYDATLDEKDVPWAYWAADNPHRAEEQGA